MKYLLTVMIETASQDLVRDYESLVRKYNNHGRGFVKLAKTNAANRDAMKDLLGSLVLWSNPQRQDPNGQPPRSKGWLQKIKDDVIQWSREQLEPGFDQ